MPVRPNAGGQEYIISEARGPFDLNEWKELSDCQTKRTAQKKFDESILSGVGPATRECAGLQVVINKLNNANVSVERECRAELDRFETEIHKFVQHQFERMNRMFMGSGAYASRAYIMENVSCDIEADPRVSIIEYQLEHCRSITALEEYANVELPYRRAELAHLQSTAVALSMTKEALTTLADAAHSVNVSDEPLTFKPTPFRGGGVSFGGE